MNSKYFIPILIILVIVIIIGIFVYTQTTNNNSVCTNYILDEAHKITDNSRRPQGTWGDMKSPNDNSQLKPIVIDPDNRKIMGDPWRFAYYSQTENIFWIADMPGEFFAGWYGAYEGYPCLR